MTRIIISQIRKCNENHKEVAGGCKLKIAQSERFFYCVGYRGTEIFLTLGTLLHINSP